MTILQFILAMLYIGLTIYCLELIYSKKLPANVFQTLLFILWINISVVGIGTLIFKSIKNFHTPIDATFAVFAGIVIIAYLVIKKSKK